MKVYYYNNFTQNNNNNKIYFKFSQCQISAN